MRPRCDCQPAPALSNIPWKMDGVPKLRMRQEAEEKERSTQVRAWKATRGDHAGADHLTVSLTL